MCFRMWFVRIDVRSYYIFFGLCVVFFFESVLNDFGFIFVLLLEDINGEILNHRLGHFREVEEITMVD